MIGVERGDAHAQADRMLERVLGYRIFEDASGKMNLSLRDTGGGLLLVPQFTLAADTGNGARPSFAPAAPPEQANHWFDYIRDKAAFAHCPVAAGRFGENMQVSVVNEGPVTFYLRVEP